MEYKDRPIGEKHLIEPQWLKLQELRNKPKSEASIPQGEKIFEVDDKVKFHCNDELGNGIVKAKYKNETYDVQFGTKFIKGIGGYWLIKRIPKVYPDVVIPEELKKYSYFRLLSLIRRFRYYDDWSEESYDEEPSRFTDKEVYAELARRPHYPNKKEAKELRRQVAKRKK